MEEEAVMAENGSLESHDDKVSVIHKESENPNVDFLKDFDSYWEDINGRLTISRAVNDSITRGIITAIESEADEKIAQKDLELSRIKETLLLYHVGSEENEASKYRSDPPNGFSQGSLKSLKTEAKKQVLLLVQELTNLRKYIHSNGGGAAVDDTLGLGNCAYENESKTIDTILDSLKSVLETVLKRKKEIELPSSWQQEHHFQKEVESAVLTSFIRSLKREYEHRLIEQEAEFSGNKSSLLGNIKEIGGLRQELELIHKLLLDHENGEIEAGMVGDRKRVQQLHRKMSGSLALVSDNGKPEENYDTLKHLSHDDLINHFKNEMNKMKIDHDYEIQEMTEKCFTFKRKYLNLKQRGSFSPVGKDKEVEALKKKIPFVISKLDKILLEDEKMVSKGKNDTDFKRRLDFLLLENRQLKDSLSEASEKMSQLSLVEADHQRLILKLESDIEDSHVEASIYKDVYGCVVSEFVGQIRCEKQETDLKHSTMREAYELIVADLASKEAHENKDEFEDSFVESFMMEECCAVIYKEALKEAHTEITELKMHVTGKEEALRSETLDKERLKEEVHWLGGLVKEKDESVQTAENNLAIERKKLEVVSQQINNLQSKLEQQQTEIQDKSKALSVVSAREVEKIESYETKISGLREEVELARESLKLTRDAESKTEEKLSAIKAEKEILKKQLQSLNLVPLKLIKGFNVIENVIAEKTQKSNFRLKNMQSQLSDLSHQMNELKRKASTYKQRLEKKCCDLEKAEAEVDILGDEVESLMDLLEKTYIALDHYSPILKHYPGIIEILKLVRRELSGESKRLQH